MKNDVYLEDASIFITTAMTASVTGSLGFKYEDGVDDAKVPQDAAYFISGGSLATAGRLRANTGKLVTLPKPARLILTIAGAANAKASDIRKSPCKASFRGRFPPLPSKVPSRAMPSAVSMPSPAKRILK